MVGLFAVIAASAAAFVARSGKDPVVQAPVHESDPKGAPPTALPPPVPMVTRGPGAPCGSGSDMESPPVKGQG